MADFQIPVLSTLVGYLAEIMRFCLQFCYGITQDLGYPSYGIAIIALTVIIKVILLPLAIKQIKSMKGMQEVQPQLAAIQKKYKNDKMRQSQEIQRLYAEKGVSPLSGCLPLLIQMPFLIAIFYALQGFPYDPNHVSFLWLESLAVPDPTYILPVISAVSTWIISKQTSGENVAGQQKMMMMVMPLMIGYISVKFPSGLVIYWIVSNLFQGIQQTIMFWGSDKNVKKVTTPQNGNKVVRKVIRKKVLKKSDSVKSDKVGSSEEAENK